MRRTMSRALVVTFVFAAACFALGALTSTDAMAGRKPKPCPNCAPTITLPDGRVCTLEACGSDCVYVCPF